MRFIKHLFIVALLLTASVAQAQMQMPTVPVDTVVKTGKLANGLTYYIRYNNWPENRANFYIAQKVGSIQEEEAQRGLAHFLEHMCFNGTEHFPGNGVIRFCESIGVQFGRDLNAYTSIDQTVYNIDNVPTNRQSALDSCLLILRDWAGSLTLDPKEIDNERGVIHEEWRLRTSASSRMFERNLPTLYPNSKYGVRYPIGLMSVIDNFKPKELRDYYEKWYHPTNQAIIVVGDVDVAKTEAEIKRLFGGMTNPANPAPIVDELVPDNAAPIVVIDKDKEQTTSEVDLMIKHDVFPDSLKNTITYMVTKYLMNAVTGMLNARLAETAQDPAAPFNSAYVYDGSYIFAKTKGALTFGVSPKEIGMSDDALQAVAVEARRAADFGFTATEYKRYQADVISSIDKDLLNKDKRTNSRFYNEIKGNFLTDEPLMPIEYYHSTMTMLVPNIPLEAVNQLAKELISLKDSNMVVLNFNNEKDGNVYPTKDGLLGAVAAARTAEISAYIDNVKDEPLMTELPKAGTITKEVKNDKFDYTELTLSNGVKVVLKKTNYKTDQVLLNSDGGAGGSVYGAADYNNIKAFNNAIGVSGLGNFSSTELQKALAGKIANVNLGMTSKYMWLNGSSTPKDVETMLQMTYLYFTGINKDQKAFDNLISQMRVQLKDLALNPDAAFNDSLTTTLYGNDARVNSIKEADLASINYDRILQMAKERTANATGWTFTFVGNFELDSIKPLICQYLGALPTSGKAEKGKRTTFMVSGVVDNTFKRKQETPKAISYMVWHNNDMPYTLENSIKADMVGQILNMIYIDKIREKESAAYSAGAQGGATIDEGYKDITIMAYCPMKPEKKDIALSIMRDEVKALNTTCDPALLTKVKEYMLKNIGDQRNTNGYWSNVVTTFIKYGIDENTDYTKIVEAQTPETIEAFMKEFNKANNRVEVTMLPAE